VAYTIKIMYITCHCVAEATGNVRLCKLVPPGEDSAPVIDIHSTPDVPMSTKVDHHQQIRFVKMQELKR